MDSADSPQMQNFKYKMGLSEAEFKNIQEVLDELGIGWEKIENPRQKIIVLAEQNLGKPYKYGASVSKDAPDFFDCSSFTSWLYTQAGVPLPRISIDQYIWGEEISPENAKEGDLIFSNSHRNVRNVFRTESVEFNPGTHAHKPVDHCGIYMGDFVIHANEKMGCVGKEKTSESEYFQDIVGIARIKEADTPRYIISVDPTDTSLKMIKNPLKQYEIDYEAYS